MSKVIDRHTYKTIEWSLYNYQDLCQKIEEQREDILESSGRKIDGTVNSKGALSDTTASKALRLASPEMLKNEKWVRVVSSTLKRFGGTCKGKLLEKKYFEQLGEVEICREIPVSRTTYYAWREEIIIYTAMIAIQEGLIKVRDFS